MAGDETEKSSKKSHNANGIFKPITSEEATAKLKKIGSRMDDFRVQTEEFRARLTKMGISLSH